MRVRVEADITIDRPPAAVFAVVTDVARHPEWSRGVERVFDLSSDPVALGTQWSQLSRIIGRQFEVHATVTNFVPERRFEFSVDKPARVQLRWRFEPASAGTHVSVAAEGNAGLFYGVVKPLLGSLRKELAADLARLKRRLEG